MNATTRTLVWTLMAAVVMGACPLASADDAAPANSEACDPVWIDWTPSIPEPHVEPGCIGPLLDNSR